MKRLDGKVALITGGGTGIGTACARTFAREGAAVVITGRRKELLETVVRDIEKAKGRALAVPGSVTDEAHVQAAVAQAVRSYGRLDILVNNAGITRDGLLLRMKEEDWNLVLQVNLNGTFNCTKAALQPMSKQRSGRIVNIASIVGAIGNAGQANYAASKAAVIGLTKTVAREYASRAVTVNAVAPGFIDTAMTQQLSAEVKDALSKQIPLGRLGQPSDVAEAVRFLASDEAGYITGHVLHVNGGMHMA